MDKSRSMIRYVFVCLCIYTRMCTQSLSHIRLCSLMACSPPDSSVHGIFQARMLEQVAISSRGDLFNVGIELASPAPAVRCFTTKPPGKLPTHTHMHIYDTYGHFTVHSLNNLSSTTYKCKRYVSFKLWFYVANKQTNKLINRFLKAVQMLKIYIYMWC